MACGQVSEVQANGEQQQASNELAVALKPQAEQLGDEAVPDLLCCPLTKVTASSVLNVSSKGQGNGTFLHYSLQNPLSVC